MASLSDETCFGDLFKRFAPFLKMYVEYCTQHENTASRVSLIAAKSDKFSNLLHVSMTSKELCTSLSWKRYKEISGSYQYYSGCFNMWEEGQFLLIFSGATLFAKLNRRVVPVASVGGGLLAHELSVSFARIVLVSSSDASGRYLMLSGVVITSKALSSQA